MCYSTSELNPEKIFVPFAYLKVRKYCCKLHWPRFSYFLPIYKYEIAYPRILSAIFSSQEMRFCGRKKKKFSQKRALFVRKRCFKAFQNCFKRPQETFSLTNPTFCGRNSSTILFSFICFGKVIWFIFSICRRSANSNKLNLFTSHRLFKFSFKLRKMLPMCCSQRNTSDNIYIFSNQIAHVLSLP